MRIITPAVGTFDLRLFVKFLNGKKNDKIVVAVLTHIFICRHNDLLNLCSDSPQFTISQNIPGHTFHFSSTLLTPDGRHEGDMTPASLSCVI